MIGLKRSLADRTVIKTWLENLASSDSESVLPELDVDRITVHLLIEVARADFAIEEGELAAVADAASQASSLSRTEIDQIVDNAVAEVGDNVSYHEHIAFINDKFSFDQKRELLEKMWQIAFADDQLDKYEEAFVRRFSDLIYMKHRDFIQAKHRVLNTLRS